jgi:TolB-like protein/Tfp pilus assembly protein PilF
VGLVAAGLWLPERLEQLSPAGADAPSIAVLPLVNLGSDPQDNALADGLTEELIGILARTEGLRVVESASVFAFRGHGGDVRRIADSLGVSNILEGGLRKTGSRLRVQMRLVDARDGSPRWSQTYDRGFEDVFAVQDDIARAVAGELGVRLDDPVDERGPRRQTRNVAAYELYLRGNDPLLTRSDSGVREAKEYFEEAIAIDPTYAAAHAGLALAHVRLGSAAEPGLPLPELYALADAAARRAVALDDSLAEAHQALGRVHMTMLDFPSAKTEIERALALDPTRPITRLTLTWLHLWAGRPSEALAEAGRALAVDPLAPIIHTEVAYALFANRRYEEALAQLDRVRGVRPPLRRVAVLAAQCYVEKGMWDRAIAALHPQAETGDPLTIAFLGHVLARAGQREEATRVLEDVLARQKRTGVGAFEVAIVYAGLGELDEAFAWLDRSVDDYSLKVQIMAPTFDTLHRDPRFERLSRRLGLQNL